MDLSAQPTGQYRRRIGAARASLSLSCLHDSARLKHVPVEGSEGAPQSEGLRARHGRIPGRHAQHLSFALWTNEKTAIQRAASNSDDSQILAPPGVECAVH